MFQSILNNIYVNGLLLASSGWKLDRFFTKLIESAKQYGGYLLILVGICALVWSIVQAFRKYVFNDNEVRTGPIVLLLGAIFGAAFAFGGWTLASNIGQGLSDTAVDFGNGGTILLNYLTLFFN